MLLPLFAFSLGIFVDQSKISPNVVRALVRDPGPPLNFTIQLRQKENKNDEWEYLAEDSFDVFPKFSSTSPIGRTVTVRLPSAPMKRYAQLCGLHSPAPDPSKRFQVLVSLQSCQNLPKPGETPKP